MTDENEIKDLSISHFTYPERRMLQQALHEGWAVAVVQKFPIKDRVDDSWEWGVNAYKYRLASLHTLDSNFTLNHAEGWVNLKDIQGLV